MTQKSDISLAHKWLSDNATLRQGFVVIEVHEDLFWNMVGINLPISFLLLRVTVQ